MKPNFSYVRVCGCLAYCTVPILNDKDRNTHVSPTAVKAVQLVDLSDERRRGWLVYIPSLNRITTTRDVTFDERKILRFDQHGNVVDDSHTFVEVDATLQQAIRVYNDTLQPSHWANPSPIP